jgi:hypothetical protein
MTNKHEEFNRIEQESKARKESIKASVSLWRKRTIVSQHLSQEDNLLEELEQENRLLRARNDRLMSELEEKVNGFDNRLKSYEKSWVGIEWGDVPSTQLDFIQGVRWAEATLKEKNT